MANEFEQWRKEWRQAVKAWRQLLPRKLLGVGGTSYLVRQLPETQAEWKALGWHFKKGARSMHPTSSTTSPLAKAAEALATACDALGDGVVTGESGRHLRGAVAQLAQRLRAAPDPGRLDQKDAMHAVEQIVGEIQLDLAQAKHEAAQAAKIAAEQAASERRIATMVAENVNTKLAQQTATGKLLAKVTGYPRRIVILLRLARGAAVGPELDAAVVRANLKGTAKAEQAKKDRGFLQNLGLVDQDTPRTPWYLTELGKRMSELPEFKAAAAGIRCV